MSYSFNLEAFGFNVRDKDEDKPRPETLIRKWWEEGARTGRCKKNQLIALMRICCAHFKE